MLRQHIYENDKFATMKIFGRSTRYALLKNMHSFIWHDLNLYLLHNCFPFSAFVIVLFFIFHYLRRCLNEGLWNISKHSRRTRNSFEFPTAMIPFSALLLKILHILIRSQKNSKRKKYIFSISE